MPHHHLGKIDAIYNYPVGIGAAGGIDGQPYMLLTSYESKNAIESEGVIISSIALYIPPNGLRTAFDANWDGLEGGAMKATLGGAFSRLNMGALSGGDWSEGNIAESLFSGFASAGTATLGKLSAAVDKGTGMLAAQGIAVNNHMALVYKGPGQFRTHDFAFNFFPKAKQDSEAIKNILKDFNDDDFLLMMGDPSIIGVACAIVAQNNVGRFSVLKWDRQEARYYPIKFNLYEKGELDDN